MGDNVSMRRLLGTFAPYLITGLALLLGYLVLTGYLLPRMSETRETSPADLSLTAVPATAQSTSLPKPAQNTQASSPTPAPVPSPTGSIPALTPQPGFSELENADRLERTDVNAAHALRALPWIRDGVEEEEREAAETLIYYAVTDSTLFWDLLSRSWLSTEAPGDLEEILSDVDNILALDPLSARKIVSMPFLDTLEPPDLLAMESLARLVYSDLNAFHRIMAHPNISDGITDEETPIVALLAGINRTNPALVETVLDFSKVTVEKRDIRPPLAGSVTLAVIRTRPGATRTMDLLEHAVRVSEELIGEPFPEQYVALFFGDAVVSSYTGTNFGTHAAILSKYDRESGNPAADPAGEVIAHEVAHFYWTGARMWLDEGAAEFTAAVSEYARIGRPLEPDHYPCSQAANIVALEAQESTSGNEGNVCNYSLGERLFFDLYRHLGEDSFRRGFRRLYLALEERNDAGATPAGIDQLKQAFSTEGNSATGTTSDLVDTVVERWYSSLDPQTEALLDTRPVVAELPTVNGWINRAYVSLAEGGTPVSAFPLSSVADRVWLTLEYSHDYSGPPQELAFEVVENYEDGFPYRRNTLTIQADRRYSGGVQWISVGPGAEQEWAPGRHWIYVYHEGRKVAEVQFEVVP